MTNEDKVPKMHWNHRVIQRDEEASDGSTFTRFQICEVYYEDDEPVALSGAMTLNERSIEDLQVVLDWCAQALKAPIINAKDFNEKAG